MFSAELMVSLNLGECLDVIYSSESVSVCRNSVTISDLPAEVDDDDASSSDYNCDYNGSETDSESDAHDDTEPGVNQASSESAEAARAQQPRWKRAQPGKWKKNVEKQRKKEEKKPKPNVCRNCRSHCDDNCSEVDRVQLCEEYKNPGSYAEKKISSCSISRSVTLKGHVFEVAWRKRRNSSIKYFFHKHNVKIRVCKRFFTSTLSIGHSPITEAIKGRGVSGLLWLTIEGAIMSQATKNRKRTYSLCANTLRNSHILHRTTQGQAPNENISIRS